MCDVGQGDALVLAAGEDTAVVVDAGPDPALVDRCLRSLGVTRVPLVLLTHFHADHVAGLPGVLRGRSVGAIETTALEEPADQADFVHRQATARRIPLRHAAAGERRRTGPLSWEVVWPPPTPPPAAAVPGPPATRRPATRPAAPPPSAEGANDASVTLLVRTAGLRLLLLGDLEPPAQQALARSPAAAALEEVDVLKVAHHGSAHQDHGLLRRVARGSRSSAAARTTRTDTRRPPPSPRCGPGRHRAPYGPGRGARGHRHGEALRVAGD